MGLIITLNFNKRKTVCMCISDKQTISEKPTILIGNDELFTVDKYCR